MKYLSVCSGIEAATVAWKPLGWRAVAFAEIERFPAAVLAHHYDTPNWGDMTAFQEWPDADVDVLVGGTPCQSFSVAGLRKGLADPRGNLALTFLAILDRYRPRWVLWENVPGVLSSEQGRDFGAFLGGLGQLGYGWGYRVLDAQYFGVPQRRRRVFVVGYLGDWRPPAAVLFERESLQGHPAPRREAGKSVAPSLAARTRGGGGLGTGFDCDGGLIPETVGAMASCGGTEKKHGHGMGQQDGEAGYAIAHALRGEGFDASEDGTGPGTPLVAQAFNWQSGGDCRGLDLKDIPDALSAKQTPAVAFFCKDHGADVGEIAPTLRSLGHDGSHANAGGQVAVAFHENQRADGPGHDPVGTRIREGMAVRRLLPIECERLQGFPDSYTAIPWRNHDADHCPDGPRYKALGTSMAVPCMRWLGERIEMVETLIPQCNNMNGTKTEKPENSHSQQEPPHD